MRIGAATAGITPDSGGDLTGYVAREQPSTGMHDAVTATALYIEEGERWILWLHADVLGHERADVQRLKATLGEYFGAPPEDVVVTASHTHAGPGSMELLGCGAYDPAYVESLHETLTGLAARAIGGAEDATLLFTEARCDLGRDRRGHASAHTDPRLPVLAWQRENGTFIAVLALYAMHNVAMGPENRLISGDVAGRAQRRLSERLPGNPIVLLANGACGNINPPSVGPDFERVERWGNEIADVIARVLPEAAPVPRAVPRTSLASLVLAPDPLSPEEIASGTAWGEDVFRNADATLRERARDIGRRWTERMASPDPAMQARNAAPVEVHAITLGAITFVGVGAEVFSVLNADIRDAAGRPVYVVGYANGNAGYICPEAAFDEGGYEPDDAYHYYGTRPIPRGAHERVAEVSAALVRSLA